MDEESKKFALEHLVGRYQKAEPMVAIADFNKCDFVIRLDMASFPVSPGKILTVGDLCSVNNQFIVNLMQNKRTNAYRAKDLLKGNYFIVAFVRLNGKNVRETFCVLKGCFDPTANAEILKSINGSLLLFWPESLIKVEK
jgi:hypothetical protein